MTVLLSFCCGYILVMMGIKRKRKYFDKSANDTERGKTKVLKRSSF